MKGRGLTAVAIVLAWLAGLGMLVQREYFRPHIERLAEAALRVQPGARFYAVMQGDQQVGFASSNVDTSTAVIESREYLVADILVGGTMHRATARTNVTLTRTLRVKTFDIALEADQGPLRVKGEVIGDTVLRLDLKIGSNPQDSARISLAGPILLPTLVPLAVALDEKPQVGKSYTLPLFDPATMGPKDVRIDVRAESLFVVNDSSVYDSTTGRWRGVLPDTIRAWQLVSESGVGGGGWVDEQGRLVASTQMGFQLRRLPYEVAYENWRKDVDARGTGGVGVGAAVASNRDVLETTAIASNKTLKNSLSQIVVRLGGVQLRGFELNGGRQRLRRDTLTVVRDSAPQYTTRRRIVEGTTREAFRATLGPEPLLEVNHPDIVALAKRIAGDSRERAEIARRINSWVHDSLRKEVTMSIPSALQVLRVRKGDCNEHTQLYVALARAAGVPARIASGLAYVDGKFYYHAWPEVALNGWVAVDPTFGQFPADAAHLRFVIGGVTRQAELLRLVGGLTVDVIATR